ncbi:MAG: DNA polymerase ligase N-terminal domain-containing protein [Brevefilum sp.]|nr:DNA polymerase ligase N-terminal domain-containing protein [Brevefilum sp.]MDT8381144.1 DNA polymerase ligase N-terminal domain-containing protein [Brevefilum sp.]MDW7755499.1 DNA polymerase ligase N-terminal domain-containing protein [Brevefilum sp.]
MILEKLADYKKKRDFNKTTEPGDEEVSFDWAEGQLVFVVQKHQASSLHYDFRIEVDGVLKSWAVPKGPSTDPSVKRLAVPTEDHPLGYADFEGVIPEGEYGGGTMIIWDRGTYRNLKEADDNGEVPSLAVQIEGGHVTIWLAGQKLQGGYALIRTGKVEKARWLLIKMDDEGADARRNPTSTEPNSVKSGLNLEEMREAVEKKD